MSAPRGRDADDERQCRERHLGDIRHAIRVREVIATHGMQCPANEDVEPLGHVGRQARDDLDQDERDRQCGDGPDDERSDPRGHARPFSAVPHAFGALPGSDVRFLLDEIHADLCSGAPRFAGSRIRRMIDGRPAV